MFKIKLTPDLEEEIKNFLEAYITSNEDLFNEMNKLWNEYRSNNRKGKIIYLNKKYSERDFAFKVSRLNTSIQQAEALERAIK